MADTWQKQQPQEQSTCAFNLILTKSDLSKQGILRK